MNEPDSPAETIFFGARDMPDPRVRAAWLDHACGTDRALRERVERMLSAEQQADQFLADDPLRLDKAARGEGPGAVIGHYKLLQQIGEGGCGVVYMAEQEEPIRRRVALKVIKLGMDTRQVIVRFEAERQALAMMDHPNIARVLDAGATDTGRPYFVMELVRGIRITDYCDKNNLGMRERLDLFVTVAHAIQHAHQKGIIHRDIKPSNVLVTLHDGVPVPKVIDFGVAKAIEQKLTDKTLFTQFEQFIGTPAYTSPEQAEMSGLDIDTRSDIYSLGVLLYELLVGQTPFDAKELLKSGLNEMRRIIREQEPNRPSTRLSTMLAEERTVTAQHRAVSSPELVHLLKGDLDWIVMKCLEKDRTRRYETASGLATDIRNYLHHEPVVARPPTAAYRFSKLLRRNKLAVGAAAAVAMALIAGTVVSLWQATRAMRAEQAANDEREVANEERDSAEAVLTFFRDKVMAAGRPEGESGGLGKDVTLRKAMDAAEPQIEEAFRDRPLVEAAIRKTLGESYGYLGEPALAVHQLEQALAIRQQNLGAEHAKTINVMMSLATEYEKAGKRDQARKLSEQVIELTKAADRIDIYPDQLLNAYRRMGRTEQGLQVLQQMLKNSRTTLGETHKQAVNLMHYLANALVETGKPGLAVPLFEELVNRDTDNSGPNDLITLTSRSSLALAHSAAGRHDLAIPLYEEVIMRCEEAFGVRKSITLDCRHGLGRAYVAAGKFDLAIPHLKAAREGREATLRPGHPKTIETLGALANAYGYAGKLDRAEDLWRKFLEKDRDSRWGRSRLAEVLIDRAKQDKADSCSAVERIDEVKKLLRDTVALIRDRDANDLATDEDLFRVAGVWIRLSKFAGEGPLYREALEQAIQLDKETLTLRTNRLGSDHPDTRDVMNDIADNCRRLGRFDEAEELYRKYLGFAKDSLNAPIGLARVLLERVRDDSNDAALAKQRADEAGQLERELLTRANLRYANEPENVEERLSEAAELYYRHKRYPEAESLYRELLKCQRDRPGAEGGAMSTAASLARLLTDWAWTERDSASQGGIEKSEIAGRAREAEHLLRKCLAMRVANDPKHWRVGDVKSRLGGALASVAMTDPSFDTTAREAKLVEAEAFLNDGNQRLQESPSADEKYQRDALERLTRLYEAWDKPAELAAWRQKLEAFDNEKPETAALPVGAH